MRLTARTRFSLVTALVAFCVLILLASLVKHGYLDWGWLGKNKESLGAANDAIGIVVLCLGAVLSYFRFFKGRALSLRAELELDVTVIEAPGGKYLLHAVGLELKNVGSFTIWNPTPVIDSYAWTADGKKVHSLADQWEETPQQGDAAERTAVLDSGETAHFLSHQTFDASVWAVTYTASVTCDDGIVWKKLLTVENRPAKKSESKEAG